MIRNHRPFDDVGAFDLIGAHSKSAAKSGGKSLFRSSGDLRLADAPNAQARVHEFRLPSLTLGYVKSTGHTVAITDSSSFTILLPVHGTIRSRTRGGELSGKAGAILTFPPDWRETRVAPEVRRAFEALVLVIPRERLVEAASAHGVRRPEDLFGLPPRFFGSTDAAAAATLAQLAGILASDVSARASSILTDQGRRSWDNLLLSKALDLLLAHRSPVMRPRSNRALVDRALAFIQSNYAAIHTTADIAEACNVSVRTLEAAFKAGTETTPSKALRNRRLDEAQSMIARHQKLSVTEIALACGFNHLGRFSGAYRSRFGVLPSAEQGKAFETTNDRTSSEIG